MKKPLVILIVFALLLIIVTACSGTKTTTPPVSAEVSQGTRQHNGGSTSRRERSIAASDADAKYTESAQKRLKDSGEPTSSMKNNNDIEQNGGKKTITGKVKSIVGNEVVLNVTQASSVTNKEKPESESQEITETYLIPVGMAIGNKDFSSIKAGNNLIINFGTDPSDGSEIITAVELR